MWVLALLTHVIILHVTVRSSFMKILRDIKGTTCLLSLPIRFKARVGYVKATLVD